MPSFMPAHAPRAVALMLGLSALSACSYQGNGFPPPCPETGILKDGGDLTQFRGAGVDLTDMVFDGRITGLSGKCTLNDATHLRTTVVVKLDVQRGPASRSRDTVMTYFISVMKGDTILDKRDYSIPIHFQENSDLVSLSTDPIDLMLPVNAKTSGAAYRVLVGFQLTPEQLAFNRRRGPR